MPVTRSQDNDKKRKREAYVGKKHQVTTSDDDEPSSPPAKRSQTAKPKTVKGRTATRAKTKAKGNGKSVKMAKVPSSQSPWMPGTVERGHIYWFYRPRVEHDEAHSIDDVRNLQMLLVPRPPQFAASSRETVTTDKDGEMVLLEQGEDAVPVEAPVDVKKLRFRLILIGKKKLPDPSKGGAGRGRKETFWATVTKVGDDLEALEKGLDAKTYETKTRGTRHEAPARLVARGGYAIVNNDPKTPSQRSTHFGYHLSHPQALGDVQKELGILQAASFVLQVKNPLAPSTGSMMASGGGKDVNYPAHIMDDTFGKGTKGRESYGLRYVSCETTELLDYEGAQLLMIGSHTGEDGLEQSLAEGRGKKLSELESEEGKESLDHIFRELGLDKDAFPMDAIKGEWI